MFSMFHYFQKMLSGLVYHGIFCNLFNNSFFNIVSERAKEKLTERNVISVTSEFKCANMPSNISFCHNGSYPGLRLPNYLGESNLLQIRGSLENMALLNECHPGILKF